MLPVCTQFKNTQESRILQSYTIAWFGFIPKHRNNRAPWIVRDGHPGEFKNPMALCGVGRNKSMMQAS